MGDEVGVRNAGEESGGEVGLRLVCVGGEEGVVGEDVWVGNLVEQLAGEV